MTAAEGSKQASLPPTLERYELKYLIPASLIDRICAFLGPYCEPDEHSLREKDYFYPVNSLYFDTPSFRFLRQRLDGADRRFNMRVRAYGDGTEPPYFAEIKHRSASSIRKFRACLAGDEWPGFLREGGVTQPATAPDGDREQQNRCLFRYLATAYAIEPKIFTFYRRRAFISQVDDYARVTFDIDMRYRVQDPLGSPSPWCLSSAYNCVNYDLETIYGDEHRHGANVIMELKATVGEVPVWMIELIRRFQLTRVGFSKYMQSCLIAHRDRGLEYCPNDRAGVARVAWTLPV